MAFDEIRTVGLAFDADKTSWPTSDDAAAAGAGAGVGWCLLGSCGCNCCFGALALTTGVGVAATDAYDWRDGVLLLDLTTGVGAG